MSPTTITNTDFIFWIYEMLNNHITPFKYRERKEKWQKNVTNTDLFIVVICNIQWDKQVDYTNWKEWKTCDDTASCISLFFFFFFGWSNKFYREKRAFKHWNIESGATVLSFLLRNYYLIKYLDKILNTCI